MTDRPSLRAQIESVEFAEHMVEAIGKVKYPSVDLQAVHWQATDKKISDRKSNVRPRRPRQLP